MFSSHVQSINCSYDRIKTGFDLLSSFSINYVIKVIFLCGDNSTEYGYEIFMVEKLVFMEKLENLYSYLHL